MNLTLQDLKTSAADLPANERAELVQFLIRSLDEPEESKVQAEWLEVADQRIADVESGDVVGIPADDVIKNLLSPRQ